MDITKDWDKIRVHFRKSFRSNLHVSVASVDAQANPTVTPIGTLFLNDDLTGFYFEKFPSKLPQNAQMNKQVCILAVNSSRWLWLKSLFFGKFKEYPAIKLYGTLGEKRTASENEIKRLNRRMKFTKGTKGHTYLWSDMKSIREINFAKAEKINLAEMTKTL